MEITAHAVPERTALIHEQEFISFATLLERMKRVASFLRGWGIQPGDRVAIQVDNRPEFAYVSGGVLMCGAVLVAINVMYLEDEIRYILQHSGARLLFSIDALAGRAQAVRSDLPDLEEVIVIGEARPESTSFETVLSCPPADSDSVPARKRSRLAAVYLRNHRPA